MQVKFEDSKAYAVVTLRDVFERCEVSDKDEPILAEVKRVYEENAKLRELVKRLFACVRQGEDEYGTDWSCAGCDFCDSCNGLIQAGEAAIELGMEVDG